MLSLSFIKNISLIDKEQWEALQLYDGKNGHEFYAHNNRQRYYHYPFIAYDFLALLESSGACTSSTGWKPHHILIRCNNDNTLIAAMPAYIKSHSYGEYMFDWAWAEAYIRHRMDYYPKIISAIPFTPCTGPRILLRRGISEDEISAVFTQLTSIANIGEETENISSFHIWFLQEALSNRLHQYGMQRRLGYQYRWFNRNYASFDDFLSTLKSRKRKMIRKERKAITEKNIVIRHVHASESRDDDWILMYQFYRQTYRKRSGHFGYLPKSFFLRLRDTLPNNVFLVFAFLEKQAVAASMFFTSPTTLFGRYWGSIADFDQLHFELCYYQGIEYCIKHNIAEFDAGVQGEHKLQRGFEAVSSYGSCHIQHPEFAEAIYAFLQHEADAVREHVHASNEQLPFTKPS